MDSLKKRLLNRLKEEKAFWSYDQVDEISNDNLIENVLLYLDLDDIEYLFLLYHKNQIRKVWKGRLLKQEPYYHDLNVFIASYYFNIKNPEKYIKREYPKLLNF